MCAFIAGQVQSKAISATGACIDCCFACFTILVASVAQSLRADRDIFWTLSVAIVIEIIAQFIALIATCANIGCIVTRMARFFTGLALAVLPV